MVVFNGQFYLLTHTTHPNLGHLLLGLGACLLGTLLASFGNMIFVYNQRYKIPMMQGLAYGTLYGTIILVIIALCMRAPLTFTAPARYWYSLIYLAVFGTIIAFWTYLHLINRIGAQKASYAFVILPIIALLLSSFFEDFYWTFSTFIGLIMIIIGNILVIMRKNKKTPFTPTIDAG